MLLATAYVFTPDTMPHSTDGTCGKLADSSAKAVGVVADEFAGASVGDGPNDCGHPVHGEDI